MTDIYLRGTPGVDWPVCPECRSGDDLFIEVRDHQQLAVSCGGCGWSVTITDRRLTDDGPPAGMQERRRPRRIVH